MAEVGEDIMATRKTTNKTRRQEKRHMAKLEKFFHLFKFMIGNIRWGVFIYSIWWRGNELSGFACHCLPKVKIMHIYHIYVSIYVKYSMLLFPVNLFYTLSQIKLTKFCERMHVPLVRCWPCMYVFIC